MLKCIFAPCDRAPPQVTPSFRVLAFLRFSDVVRHLEPFDGSSVPILSGIFSDFGTIVGCECHDVFLFLPVVVGLSIDNRAEWDWKRRMHANTNRGRNCRTPRARVHLMVVITVLEP